MVIKIIELVGCSPKSFDGAVKEALTRAKKTVNGITGIDVVGQKCVVKNGKISEYRAHVKVAFEVK